MSVDVALGRAYVGATVYSETGTTNLPIDAAHSTLYRKDLITYDPTTSNPVVTKGSNHAGGTADPIYPPNIPAGDILLAIVDVDTGVGAITDSDIHDCRVDLGAGAGKLYTYKPSSATLKSDTSEETTASDTYVKLKEITALPGSVVGARLRISFDLKHGSSALTAHGIIRCNGEDVGTPQSVTGTSYDTFSEDIPAWCAGDVIELWLRTNNTSGTAYVRNLYVKGVLKTITPIETVYSW